MRVIEVFMLLVRVFWSNNALRGGVVKNLNRFRREREFLIEFLTYFIFLNLI